MTLTAQPQWKPVYADWLDRDIRRRIAAGRRQHLSRALGLHNRPHATIIDATGGMGRDALVLAALGARLHLLERNATVFELLRDAQQRALCTDQADLRAAAKRIELIHVDARQWLGAHTRNEHRIYLDPMYPQHAKNALPQKSMQVLRAVCGDNQDADELLHAALATPASRVVVKRPSTAPHLGAAKPDASIKATQTRFDLYFAKGGTVPS
ncbi:MAG: class I SAM-dependent methyltransferase [Panacagrimonas sp.]